MCTRSLQLKRRLSINNSKVVAMLSVDSISRNFIYKNARNISSLRSLLPFTPTSLHASIVLFSSIIFILDDVGSWQGSL